MKPALLFMAAFFLAISVTGQSINEKATTDPHNRQRGFKSHQYDSNRVEKNVMHPVSRYHSQQFNRLKAAGAEQIILDSTIGHIWNGDAGRWVADYKEAYTYDAAGNMLNYIDYDADTISNRWVVDEKEEYTYDVSGNNTVYIFAEWDTVTGDWVSYYKNEYIFDDGGKNTQNIYYDRDQSTGQWEAGQKTDLVYNAGGNLILELTSYKENDTSEWMLYMKDSIFYDAQGNRTGNINSFLDFLSQSWLANSLNESTYDAAGNLIRTVDSYWIEDTTGGQWSPVYKTEYAYNAGGKIIRYTDYDWYDADSLWIANYKEEFDYDANGNMFQFLDYVWYDEWFTDYKGTFTYNNSYSGSDIFLPYFYAEFGGIIFNHMLTRADFFFWDEDAGDFINDEKMAFYYSGISGTAVAVIRDAGINVYPNPVSGHLSFDSGNDDQMVFELFDMQGRKILSAVLRNGEKLNMQGLKSGIYFYNLFTGGKEQHGKLIKE